MTEIIPGNICLERAFSFATTYSQINSWQRCKAFHKGTTRDYFQLGRTTCQTTCHIELEYNNNEYWQYSILEVVSVVFDSYNNRERTGCVSYYEAGAQLLINCSQLGKERLGIFWNSVCKERNAECSKWHNFCVCHCDREYLMHGGHCVKGNQSNNKVTGIVQTEKQESSRKNLGAILGSLFGGLVLGLIIATGIGFIVYRRFRSSIQTRANAQIMFSMNDTYNTSREDDIIKQDKQKRVLNVPPLTRSEESPEYSNTSGKQSALTVTDDVYNHLNEIKETQDENTYDHACSASVSGRANDLGDYSNDHGLNNNLILSGGTGTDDYSTLEKK